MNKLYLGDCLEIMKEIPDNSIDMVCCDPPYGINHAEWDVIHNNKNIALGGKSPAQDKSCGFSRRGKPINGWSEDDKKAGAEYQEWCKEWMAEAIRVLKPAAPILIFNSRRLMGRAMVALEDSGGVIKDTLIWEKDRAHGKAQNVGKIPCIKKSGISTEGFRAGNLKPMYEPIIYGFKPYRGTISENFIKNKVGFFYCEGVDIKSNIFKYSVESGLHPTQKPIPLMEDLIKTFSVEGAVILDCFMGSGTTILAAKNLNRQFIGIEKDAGYFEIAKKRIEE